MNAAPPSKLIIEGVTPDGRIFRPSDWAERMCGRLATFRYQRITYSPLLHPGLKNGNKCIILDATLQESHTELFEHLLQFAKVNNLVVWEE